MHQGDVRCGRKKHMNTAKDRGLLNISEEVDDVLVCVVILGSNSSCTWPRPLENRYTLQQLLNEVVLYFS